MKKEYGTHVPGEPAGAEPPPRLVELTGEIRHPYVRSIGITCTEDGRWALYVTVPKQANVPLTEVEAKAEGFPVVYETDPDEPLSPYSYP